MQTDSWRNKGSAALIYWAKTDLSFYFIHLTVHLIARLETCFFHALNDSKSWCLSGIICGAHTTQLFSMLNSPNIVINCTNDVCCLIKRKISYLLLISQLFVQFSIKMYLMTQHFLIINILISCFFKFTYLKNNSNFFLLTKINLGNFDWLCRLRT